MSPPGKTDSWYYREGDEDKIPLNVSDKIKLQHTKKVQNMIRTWADQFPSYNLEYVHSKHIRVIKDQENNLDVQKLGKELEGFSDDIFHHFTNLATLWEEYVKRLKKHEKKKKRLIAEIIDTIEEISGLKMEGEGDRLNRFSEEFVSDVYDMVRSRFKSQPGSEHRRRYLDWFDCDSTPTLECNNDSSDRLVYVVNSIYEHRKPWYLSEERKDWTVESFRSYWDHKRLGILRATEEGEIARLGKGLVKLEGKLDLQKAKLHTEVDECLGYSIVPNADCPYLRGQIPSK